MGKDPAFLFYYQDFLVGTTFMSMEERGAYITLLCHMADKGKIQEQEILKLISFSTWESISKKFKRTGDRFFYHKRLLQEVEKRRAYCESRRKNREKHMSNICKSYDRHMENENENKDKKKQVKSKYTFITPSLDVIIKYSQEQKIAIDAHAFFDFYESKGWMVGKNKMKDWKAAVRNWARRNKEQQKPVVTRGQDDEALDKIKQWEKEAQNAK
jgi:uncharacterized protein YdaU (DUF1376 family)